MRRALSTGVMLALLSAAAPALTAAPSCPDTKLAPIVPTHALPPYPILSQRLGEQGATVLMVEIGPDGIPTATNISKSSGSLRLDDAAAAFVKDNWRWQAPTHNCKPLAAATNVTVNWALKGNSQAPPFIVITAADSDFPTGAKAQGAHGNTVVAAVIAPDGTVQLQLAVSSGFNDLDSAAFAKINAMKFAPASLNGTPTTSVLFFRIDWGPAAAMPGTSPPGGPPR
jgi:TonB family protein